MACKTLEESITEALAIKASIYEVKYGYSISDTSRYEIWKQSTIRILSAEFPGDRCIEDFENAITSFQSGYRSPSSFDMLIGVLTACRDNPTIIRKNSITPSSKGDKAININVNQTQTQTQKQVQSIAIEIFIDAVRDELTGKQVKEIKEIYAQEPDVKKARTKIFDKIKSFGSDVASNVLANILTNPAIWGNL